ncbi:MAG TPA: NusG domain II-containing protein [bacterium]|nr:NusG domain II-containing protein [bacterium]HOC88524.1 NusG domain II-containing protein [bacterium]HOZ21013.1 NusG domain II-containing protein [bacterium]
MSSLRSTREPAPAGRLLTHADLWLLGAGIVVGLLLSALLLPGRHAGREVLIESRGALYVRARLDAPALYEVPGPLGVTVVEIRGGAVRVLSSPCPEKYCVHSGSVSRQGRLIVCVPNRVVVRIPGGTSGSLDMITE